jgi:hypothetical protein
MTFKTIIESFTGAFLEQLFWYVGFAFPLFFVFWILGKKYFEEQLQRIREIRLSERKFYQKITDIYATAIDYDVTADSTKRFFATVQNKLHWAIHGQTPAEVIHKRANHQKENMGLSNWQDAPNGKIQKFDVSVAKNYLT